MKTLMQIAGESLPPPLSAVWRLWRDAEAVAAAAEDFVATYRAVGNVGEKAAQMGVRSWTDGQLRVDCWNNPEFWLEVDVDRATAKGRVPTCLYPGGLFVPGLFEVEVRSNGDVHVTHSSAPAFYVALLHG